MASERGFNQTRPKYPSLTPTSTNEAHRGTTNDKQYLRDPTGNRSYWPIHCPVKSIDFRAVIAERDLMWQQAVHEYDEMRAKYPTGDMPLTLTGAALTEAKMLQERARQKEMWESWLEATLDWAKRPVTRLSLFAENHWELEPTAHIEDLVVRAAFTKSQAFEHALGLRPGEPTNPTQDVAWQKVTAALGNMGFVHGKPSKLRGSLKRWIIFPDTGLDTRKRGFTSTGEAEPTTDSQDDLL